MNSSVVGVAADTGMGKTVPVVLALLGAAIATGFIVFVSAQPATVIPVVLFLLCVVAGIFAPSLSWLPLGQRSIVVLLALRPLLDTGHSAETVSTSSQDLPLQGIYAVAFAATLVVVWRKSKDKFEFGRTPSRLIALVLATVCVAWMVGGIKSGVDAFVRTAWGLLVALLLGPLFKTRREIDLFIRVIFRSSVLFLFVLAFHTDQWAYLSGVWRLGGQYGVPNALGAVAFSLFAYGLYALDISRTSATRFINFSLLVLLGIVIAATQSRTAGGLMVIAVVLWLWARGYRRLLYTSAIVLAILVTSRMAADWRVTSDVFGKDGRFDILAIGLTGRTLLWGETIQNYLDASTFHQVIGLGWGTMYENFSLSKLADVSSVTESSFLWFLAGAGIAGLASFSSYLGWISFRGWKLWRNARSRFDARFGFLAFLVAIAFIVESFTFDLVLSPVASGYLYAILSIAAYRELDSSRERSDLVTTPLQSGAI